MLDTKAARKAARKTSRLTRERIDALLRPLWEDIGTYGRADSVRALRLSSVQRYAYHSAHVFAGRWSSL